MTTGTVKFFNESKGYGFIAPDGGGNDAFVHISAVERAGMRSLGENQRVSYDLEQDKKLYHVTESGIVVVEGNRSSVDVSTVFV